MLSSRVISNQTTQLLHTLACGGHSVSFQTAGGTAANDGARAAATAAAMDSAEGPLDPLVTMPYACTGTVY